MSSNFAAGGRYARVKSAGSTLVVLVASAGIGAGIILAGTQVAPAAGRHSAAQRAAMTRPEPAGVPGATAARERYEALKERQLAALERNAVRPALPAPASPRERYVEWKLRQADNR